jgi:hypothetical protein
MGRNVVLRLEMHGVLHPLGLRLRGSVLKQRDNLTFYLRTCIKGYREASTKVLCKERSWKPTDRACSKVPWRWSRSPKICGECKYYRRINSYDRSGVLNVGIMWWYLLSIWRECIDTKECDWRNGYVNTKIEKINPESPFCIHPLPLRITRGQATWRGN